MVVQRHPRRTTRYEVCEGVRPRCPRFFASRPIATHRFEDGNAYVFSLEGLARRRRALIRVAVRSPRNRRRSATGSAPAPSGTDHATHDRATGRSGRWSCRRRLRRSGSRNRRWSDCGRRLRTQRRRQCGRQLSAGGGFQPGGNGGFGAPPPAEPPKEDKADEWKDRADRLPDTNEPVRLDRPPPHDLRRVGRRGHLPRRLPVRLVHEERLPL